MHIISRIINKKRVLYLGIAALVLYVSSQALAPVHYMIVCDPCCDSEINKAIQTSAQHALLTKVTGNYLLAELNKEYPFVKAVEIRRYSSKRAHIKISTYKPLIKITSSLSGHKEYFVCTNECLFEKKFFNKEYTENLPALLVAGSDYEEKMKDPELTACAMALSYELFEKFVITWHSKSEILLQSRDTKSILIADIHTINDKARYESIERIIASEPEKYSNGIKADIRLSDSLVCSPL